jgi:hypothetical protein
MYVDSSKNEDTWYRILGHYDAENREQTQTASRSRKLQGVVKWMVFYTDFGRQPARVQCEPRQWRAQAQHELGQP